MNKFVYNFIAWLLWGTFRFPVQVYAEKLRLYIKHRERLAVQRYVAYLLNDYIGDKSEVYRYFEDWNCLNAEKVAVLNEISKKELAECMFYEMEQNGINAERFVQRNYKEFENWELPFH